MAHVNRNNQERPLHRDGEVELIDGDGNNSLPKSEWHFGRCGASTRNRCDGTPLEDRLQSCGESVPESKE